MRYLARCSMFDFFMAKKEMVNVRLKPETHAEFKIACELRGVSMSSLMHQFIVQIIRSEKERDPIAFIPRVAPEIKSALDLRTPYTEAPRRKKPERKTG